MKNKLPKDCFTCTHSVDNKPNLDETKCSKVCFRSPTFRNEQNNPISRWTSFWQIRNGIIYNEVEHHDFNNIDPAKVKVEANLKSYNIGVS